MLFNVINDLVLKWKEDFQTFLSNAIDTDKLTQAIWTRLQSSQGLPFGNNSVSGPGEFL